MARQLTIDGGDEPVKGAARPVTVYLPPDILEQLEHRAGQEERTVSNYVKRCVVAALRDGV